MPRTAPCNRGCREPPGRTPGQAATAAPHSQPSALPVKAGHTAGSAVLVTSRSVIGDLAGATTVVLGGLVPDDAVRILRSGAGPVRMQDEPDAAREISALCDGLPLALRIAAAKLGTRPSWSLSGLRGPATR